MTRALTDALARGLAQAGVRRMFGVPGGGPNLDMVGSAQALGIEFVLTHGETAACIAAGVHGRLTGTAGVAVVTRGPGFTSAATGLAQATLDRFPLLLLSDGVGAGQAARVAHQRLDQAAAAAPLTRWSGTLGAADPQAVVAAAARLAARAPAGAVSLVVDPGVPGDVPPAAPGTPPPAAALSAQASRMLAASRRPVLLVGIDALDHVDAVRSALSGLDAPVMTTYEAAGVVPQSWPTYAGLFTGAVIERPLLAQADLVVGVGLDPVEPMPGGLGVDVPVLLLHGHPIETAYFTRTGLPQASGCDPVQVNGSWDDDLLPLLAGLRPDWPPGTGARVHRSALDALRADAPGLTPHDVVTTTREVLGDVPVTVDAGAHMLVAMPLWHTDSPGQVLISNGLATMGFALPAAVGAALARPGRRVACLTGDGGLGMVLAELETMSRLRLDVTVVVLNDAALTLIGLKQRAGQGGPSAIAYSRTDFAAVAAGMGVPGAVVDDVRSLRAALAGTTSGPLLVDARIDPSVYPHVLRTIRG